MFGGYPLATNYEATALQIEKKIILEIISAM